MFSRPLIQTFFLSLSIVLKCFPFIQESYKYKYLNNIDFKDIYLNLINNIRCDDEIYYFLKEGLLYKENTLCVPQGERV